MANGGDTGNLYSARADNCTNEVLGDDLLVGREICNTGEVYVRLPPDLNTNPQSSISWVAPPPGWFYGNWKLTYTSQATYFPLINLQFDSSPVFPQSAALPGQNNDLTSFQIGNSSAVVTAFGIDTPHRSNDKTLGPEWDAVYDFVGTGGLANVNNSWEVMAWGYDTCGEGYMVVYETAVATTGASAGLDIESRSDQGPSDKTLADIFNGLTRLGNNELTSLVQQTKKLTQNGRRRGMGPVVCDAACVNNTETGV